MIEVIRIPDASLLERVSTSKKAIELCEREDAAGRPVTAIELSAEGVALRRIWPLG